LICDLHLRFTQQNPTADFDIEMKKLTADFDTGPGSDTNTNFKSYGIGLNVVAETRNPAPFLSTLTHEL